MSNSSVRSIRIEDDEMAPTIRKGEYCNFVFAAQADIQSGDAVIVMNREGKISARRFIRDGKQKLLASDNPTYPTLALKGFLVLGQISDIWTRRSS